jgi:Fanconi-associated nuclease 1
VPIEDAVRGVLGSCPVVGGENSIWRTLFGLLFFDLLWLPVPGMLPVEGLDAPLDYGTRHFASARAGLLAARLKDLSEGHGAAIMGAGLGHRGCSIRGVNWRFSDAELLAVVGALPGPLVAGVLERMAWEGERSWSGLPDLLVLDGGGISIEGAFPARLPGGPLFVEVKGPGDSLRDGQRVWIDRLLALGARVEVWRVEGRPMDRDLPAESPCASSSPVEPFVAAPCPEKSAPESAPPPRG